MLIVKAINVEKHRKAWGEYNQCTPVAWVSTDGERECRVEIAIDVYWAMRNRMTDSDYQEVDYIGFTPALHWHMGEPGQPYRFERVQS